MTLPELLKREDTLAISCGLIQSVRLAVTASSEPNAWNVEIGDSVPENVEKAIVHHLRFVTFSAWNTVLRGTTRELGRGTSRAQGAHQHGASGLVPLMGDKD
jgi:hypothetical protein